VCILILYYNTNMAAV